MDEIKRIKDKWLDCKKLTEKEEALLFARIEKLEDVLKDKKCGCGLHLLSDGTCPMHFQHIESKIQVIEQTAKCPHCQNLFKIHIAQPYIWK